MFGGGKEFLVFKFSVDLTRRSYYFIKLCLIDSLEQVFFNEIRSEFARTELSNWEGYMNVEKEVGVRMNVKNGFSNNVKLMPEVFSVIHNIVSKKLFKEKKNNTI